MVTPSQFSAWEAGFTNAAAAAAAAQATQQQTSSRVPSKSTYSSGVK